MIRYPAAAGRFYPESAKSIDAMLETLVNKDAEKEEVIGALLPHAGYPYSGSVAGAAISAIRFPDTAVIIGPNHSGNGRPFAIMTDGVWRMPAGDVSIDSELAGLIMQKSTFLEADSVAHQYEHSIEVQLPFLQYFKEDIKIVPISLAHGTLQAYQEIGKSIAEAVRQLGRNVVVLASGDMTHYEPQDTAERKDNKAIEAILDLDEAELVKRVNTYNITMCGAGAAAVMLSAVKGLGASSAKLVRYRTSGDATGDYSSVVGYAGIIIKKEESYSPLVTLAKKAVENYIREGKTLKAKEFNAEMREKAGVFVSIKKMGKLRGCIGTFEPRYESIAEETVANAISAATSDPRFRPVSPIELDQLQYSVDVLSKPELVDDMQNLDPKKYGVIVESGFRKGLLLPDLEGIDTVEEQVNVTRQKAGIEEDEPIIIYRFEVKRYG